MRGVCIIPCPRMCMSYVQSHDSVVFCSDASALGGILRVASDPGTFQLSRRTSVALKQVAKTKVDLESSALCMYPMLAESLCLPLQEPTVAATQSPGCWQCQRQRGRLWGSPSSVSAKCDSCHLVNETQLKTCEFRSRLVLGTIVVRTVYGSYSVSVAHRHHQMPGTRLPLGRSADTW